jgi:hypothetical protein
MLTWQGLGFLAVLTWLGPLIPVWGYTDRAFVWPSIFAHVVSVSITYLLGRVLNKIEVKHYFCGIRFEYSGFFLSGVCACVYAFHLMATH